MKDEAQENISFRETVILHPWRWRCPGWSTGHRQAASVGAAGPTARRSPRCWRSMPSAMKPLMKFQPKRLLIAYFL